MSMWGFARNTTKSYLTNLNARAALNVVKGTAREFGKASSTRRMLMDTGMVSGKAAWWPMAGGVYHGGAEFGKRAGRYFMGGGTAGRITRMGTAGVGLFAGAKAMDTVGRVGGFATRLPGRLASTPFNIMARGDQDGPF